MVFMQGLKDVIISQIKLHINPEDYDKIDVMFSEMYLVKENGEEFICLRPFGSGECVGDISLMFSALNGAYYDMGQWSYIQRIGEQI